MDDRRDRERSSSGVQCPPRSAGSALSLPGVASEGAPRVDDRLAPPETRIEYLHGVELYASPADEPHATRHSLVDRVVGSYVAPGYVPAVDMLTRTDASSDFAPDFSIFPAEPDPATGGRKLEEIAFEIASEQSLTVPTRKARELVRRGVRRVLCLLVKQRRVLEWSREEDGWRTLPGDAVLEDPCLVRPLPVGALLDAAQADDAIGRALLEKRPPSIARALETERSRGQQEGHKEGHKEGHLTAARDGLRRVLQRRGLTLTPAESARIEACDDLATLVRWLEQAVDAASVEQALE